jgi:hypothetical protein
MLKQFFIAVSLGQHCHFPSDEAATKLIFLALRNITTDWGRAALTGNRP